MRIPAAPPAGGERIAAAFARSGKRAAFMPYLMGGFPDLAASRGIGEAYVAAGADVVELGVPFSDPLADGPVIQAAGAAALGAGATTEDVLRVGGALAIEVFGALLSGKGGLMAGLRLSLLIAAGVAVIAGAAALLLRSESSPAVKGVPYVGHQ